MANMFRDAGKKTITPHIKTEEDIKKDENKVTDEPKEKETVENKEKKTSSKRTDVKKETVPKKKKSSGLKNSSMALIEDSLEKSTKNTYSVYLDDDIKTAIDDLAKAKHTSRSKIINILLRNTLFEE